ncbi:MAG: hypothetical protein MZV70_11695 [Desulfobacterales bacterium]|nr:hypothetical protein [Desulfobacterales bacterium]
MATFCMGNEDTYEFIDDNPSIEFRTIDYTNNPLVIARHDNMVAINSALEIDLTGQATAESIGRIFHSGVGRAGGLHARRRPGPGRKDHPGHSVHRAQGYGLPNRSVPQRGRRGDTRPGGRPLRRHGIRHRLPSRQEHP